jgi:hypothetical protein
MQTHHLHAKMNTREQAYPRLKFAGADKFTDVTAVEIIDLWIIYQKGAPIV